VKVKPHPTKIKVEMVKQLKVKVNQIFWLSIDGVGQRKKKEKMETREREKR